MYTKITLSIKKLTFIVKNIEDFKPKLQTLKDLKDLTDFHIYMSVSLKETLYFNTTINSFQRVPP